MLDPHHTSGHGRVVPEHGSDGAPHYGLVRASCDRSVRVGVVTAQQGRRIHEYTPDAITRPKTVAASPYSQIRSPLVANQGEGAPMRGKPFPCGR